MYIQHEIPQFRPLAPSSLRIVEDPRREVIGNAEQQGDDIKCGRKVLIRDG
jgi:hypothetical protein